MLRGIRVLDFTQYIPGPFAGMRLASMGAEVIKIEPLQGDPVRSAGFDRKEGEALFSTYNRFKQSISINIKTTEGVALVRKLIRYTDVLLESFRPGVMKRLGLDYEQVQKEKEDLIYCSIRGYGNEGKKSEMGSHDLNYLALSGMLSQMMDSEGKPVHPRLTLVDLTGGLMAAEAIVAALFQRERTGKGRHIWVSLLDAATTLMEGHLAIYRNTGTKHGVSLLTGNYLCYHIYRTSDHRYMALAALEEKFWHRFCDAVDRPEWYSAGFTRTVETNPFYRAMRELFRSRTFAEWTNFAEEMDCCLTPVMDVDEVLTGEDRGKRTGSFPLNSVAEIGEDTDRILADILDFQEEDIKKLKEKGVIGS